MIEHIHLHVMMSDDVIYSILGTGGPEYHVLGESLGEKVDTTSVTKLTLNEHSHYERIP